MEESWRWFAVFGEPRQTVNADLVARLLGRHAELLVERLAGGVLRRPADHRQRHPDARLLQPHSLDQDYLVHWAGELGVRGLLDRALDEAGLS
jgi:hypothetical protein